MAAQTQAWACCHSLVGIAGSNPAGDMDVYLLLVLCVVKQRSLRLVDPPSRGVLPTAVCPSVIVKPR